MLRPHFQVHGRLRQPHTDSYKSKPYNPIYIYICMYYTRYVKSQTHRDRRHYNISVAFETAKVFFVFQFH